MDNSRPTIEAIRESIGTELRVERARVRMSRAQLSEASGVSPVVIYRLENAARDASVIQLIPLTTALGIGMVQFMTRVMATLDTE